MPLYEIEHNGKTYEVDAKSMEEAASSFSQAERRPPSFMDRASALPAGFNTGVAYTAGIPVDTVANVRDLGKSAIGSLVGAFSKTKGQPIPQGKPGPYGTGKSFDVDESGKLVPSRTYDTPNIPSWLQINPRAQDFGSGESIREMMNKLPGRPADMRRPDDPVSRFLFAGGAALPAAMTMQPTNAPQALNAVKTVLPPALAAQTASEIAPDSTSAPLLAAFGTMGVQSLLRGSRPNANAPSKEQLKKESAAAYKRAEDSGATITSASFDSAKSKIAQALADDGIDPTLHPKSTAALKRIMDTQGDVSFKRLETLRRIANDAKGAIEPADSRMAAKMIDAIDDFAENVQPQDLAKGSAQAADDYKTARSLWSRARKTDEIDELIRKAEISAPNFSASGMENALRTEFRALAKNANKMRRFTPEEQAAITRVAKGGHVENALRMLGKFAPTGVVSAGLSSGLGFLAGGPAGAAALPAIGGASRYGASKMTQRNALNAGDLMRRGPQAKTPPLPPMSTEQLGAYLTLLGQQSAGILGQ